MTSVDNGAPATPAPKGQTGMAHMPALDGLRGLAVMGVVWFHLGGRYGKLVTGGYLGVDLFFVLSGFLITSVLLHELDSRGRVDFTRFWLRRARRLLPAMLSLVPAIAIYTHFLSTAKEATEIRNDGLATLGYVANWRAIFSQKSYWDLFSAPSPLEHTWSLAIEEQFYVFWPLLFWLGMYKLRANRTLR
jgi:peptidoglycan/LPS O-acetylase OafA/YrhL